MNKTLSPILGITLVGVLALLIPSAHADTFGSGANTFTIDFVTIGDPGNPADSGTTGSYFTPYGAVGYTFQMGMYEISRDMITKSNAPVGSGGGGLGLTLANMTGVGGNIGTHPATGVSWNMTARFVNWLNVISGYAPAYKFTLQPGDGGYSANADLVLWTPADAGYDVNNLYRNRNAHYFLPSENEWYKAAYYSGSGTTYYDYPTQQDAPTVPTPVASGTGSGSAVYGQSVAAGPTTVTQAGGLSHYGTMGQGGNANEWLESAQASPNDLASENRVIRGGHWNLSESNLRSSGRSAFGVAPSSGGPTIGFRVASVPEPSTAVFGIALSLSCILKRRRARAL